MHDITLLVSAITVPRLRSVRSRQWWILDPPSQPCFTNFWFSSIDLRTSIGAPPTVAIKCEIVHKLGIPSLNFGYSCFRSRKLLPLSIFTSLCAPVCGSTSHNNCTGSGLTSSSMISTPTCSSATLRMISFGRCSISPTRTFLRYFGYPIMGYRQGYPPLRFLLNPLLPDRQGLSVATQQPAFYPHG